MRARLILLFATMFLTAGIPAAEAPESKELFNGKDLQGWKATNFGGEGETEVKDGKSSRKWARR